jgi:hypothetical protein
MKFSLRLMASNITCGEQLIRMEMLLMCFFKNGVIVRQQDDSLKGY